MFGFKASLILFELFVIQIQICPTRGDAPAGRPVLHGMRLGDFPRPDFTKTIKSLQSQKGKSSFKRINLPKYFDSVPDLVKVYASTEDGDSAGFHFEGTGACQNPGSKGYYGGLIFAYNSNEVRVWAPTKYYGNTNGKLIYVEDGWGGEKYTQSSRIADVTVEVWNKIVTPNFRTEIQVDATKSFYEVPHKLKQIPDFISVRVYSRHTNTFDKNLLFHFHAAGVTQSPPDALEYGGVVFAYNETFVRLWLPNSEKNPETGCVKITKGWGDGKYANEMNSRTCQIEIRAWINSFPAPAFQTDWSIIRANAHRKSFKEIYHNLGIDTVIVQAQVKRHGRRTDGYIFEGMGSVQATQSGRSKYGGFLFAYDRQRLRIWVPSSDTDEKGRVILVSNSWGNGTHLQDFDDALYRIRIYAPKCSKVSQIVDGQGVCRDSVHNGLVWKTSDWGDCSSSCSTGIQKKQLVGCHTVGMETVFSCNFEQNSCNFTSRQVWRRSRGFFEKKNEPYGFTQPPSGFQKGSYFIYSVLQKLGGGSLTQLISPRFSPRRNCKLRFFYNTGVYFNHFEVHVLIKGKSYIKWRMTDKQPGNPYIWFPGFVNLEYDNIEQFRFSLRLGDRCRSHCGYVAFDDITIQCETEEQKLIELKTCDQKSIPLPGCAIDVIQPLHKGPAFTKEMTRYGEYVKANGTHLDQIATYDFKTQSDGYYNIWFDFLGTTLRDNSVTYQIDDGPQITSDLIVKRNEPAWNCLNRRGIFLKSGTHRLTLIQYERGFRYRTMIVAPNSLVTWSSLGLQNVHINDMFLKSGLQTVQDRGPLIRLNGQGAWLIDDGNFGWVHWEIKFPDLALVYKVAIQGGCQEEGACCATDSFQLSFSIDGKNYAKYRNTSGEKHMFPGTSKHDPNRVVMATLQHAVPARGIRFYPFQTHLLFSCLRVEVYGHYMTKGMCSHAGIKPDLIRSCTGDRKCGPNAECLPAESRKVKDDRETCQCSPGFHGDKCQFVGCNPNPCKNDATCKIRGQIFQCSCKPGFTGKFCQLPCPKGRYGPKCNYTCFCPGRSHCHPVTGECNCERGYTGMRCNEVCPKGLYGDDCAEICKCNSFMQCDHVTGSCYCPLGYHGDLCDISCSSGFYGRNCSSLCRCAKHSKCLPNNGTCLCPTGWTGEFCMKPCPDGMYGKGCSKTCKCPKNSICNKVNGVCACKKGWKGSNCDQRCPEKYFGRDCIHPCNCEWRKTKFCDPVSGKCVCKAGFTGKSCEKNCPYDTYGPNCKLSCKCQNNAFCDAATGVCRCPDGFIGNFCQTVCPNGKYGRNCSENCRCVSNQTEECNFRDGTCDCLPGYKGKKCHKTCVRGYWGKNCEIQCLCYNGAHCDPIDGFCSCAAGWQGESCESACDNQFYGTGCKIPCKCQNGAVCNRFNGNCTCAPGYVGSICDQKCPQWKFGSQCRQSCVCNKPTSSGCSNVNGTCFCEAGYEGKNCQKECDDGKYGIGCKLSCPSCSYHVTGPCKKTTGVCKCSLGYYGDLCLDYCPLDSYGFMCQSTCNCTAKEICSNIDGLCFNRKKYEFFMRFRQRNDIFRSTEMRRNLTMNLELLMAKYYDQFNRLIDKRKKRDITRNYEIFRQILPKHRTLDAPNSRNTGSQVTRRDIGLDSSSNDCGILVAALDAGKYSVRITRIEGKYDSIGNPIENIGLVAVYKNLPLNEETVGKFLSSLPENCLSMKKTCPDCILYSGKIYDKKPEDTKTNLWIIIGCSSGAFFVCLAIAFIIVKYRRQQSISSSIYKVKKNSRDIELRHCLASGDGGHVLAFENPYYDVIAAMGLDDDIEEDYYNPLFSFDDVSLYCDDQASESETETNNDDGYLYPYDRDSGISSGTIHQA